MFDQKEMRMRIEALSVGHVNQFLSIEKNEINNNFRPSW